MSNQSTRYIDDNIHENPSFPITPSSLHQLLVASLVPNNPKRYAILDLLDYWGPFMHYVSFKSVSSGCATPTFTTTETHTIFIKYFFGTTAKE